MKTNKKDTYKRERVFLLFLPKTDKKEKDLFGYYKKEFGNVIYVAIQNKKKIDVQKLSIYDIMIYRCGII